MGRVTFYAQDVIDGHDGELYPNTWATVTPPKGYEAYAGKLQIILLPESDVSTDSPIDQFVIVPRMPPTLTIGPEMSSSMTVNSTSQETRGDCIKCATTPGVLHVYDVSHNTKSHTINGVLTSLSTVRGIVVS
jgi:hypothetical protein